MVPTGPVMESFSIEFLPRLRDTDQRWLWRVPWHSGESLTSLVGRQARRCHLSFRSMLAELDPAYSNRLPDLDFAPSKRLLSVLSTRLGISEESLRRGTLDQYLPYLIPESDQVRLIGHTWRPRHLPWVLPHGWNHYLTGRNPKHGGAPFCVSCWLEDGDPWSPLLNRLSFTVACPRHREMLLDRCPNCGSKTSPAISGLRMTQTLGGPSLACPRCTISCDPTEKTMVAPVSSRLLDFQEAIHRGLIDGHILLPQLGRLSMARFLTGLRFLHSVVSCLLEHDIDPPLHRPRKYSQHLISAPRGKQQLSLEFCSVGVRATRLDSFAWVCERPLDRWPALQQMGAWPRSLTKSWHHPWEAVDELGHAQMKGGWHVRSYRFAQGDSIGKIRDFFELVDALDLSADQARSLLGGISDRQFKHWKAAPSLRVPLTSNRRMEQLLRIWESLIRLYGEATSAKKWLATPNDHPAFQGQSPLSILISDEAGERAEEISRFLGPPG